jgi:hypothetical protein
MKTSPEDKSSHQHWLKEGPKLFSQGLIKASGSLIVSAVCLPADYNLDLQPLPFKVLGDFSKIQEGFDLQRENKIGALKLVYNP